MTGHMSAFTNFILSSYRIPLSFQFVSMQFQGSFLGPSYSCFDVFRAAALACLDGFNIGLLEGVYLGHHFSINVNRHICISSPTTISFVFRAFNCSSLFLPASFTLCTMLFISCGDLLHSAVSSPYRKF